MAFNITQTPTEINLSQSPIVFGVHETDSATVATSSFQYFADLYYWEGTKTDSGSEAQFTLAKYPNQSNYAFFDVSKILNSTFSSSLAEKNSRGYYFAIDTYYGFTDGDGLFVTSSHIKSDTYTVIDGYKLYGEEISDNITDISEHWPLITDAPYIQTIIEGDLLQLSVFTGQFSGVQCNELRLRNEQGTTTIFLSESTNTKQFISQRTFELSPNTSFLEIEPRQNGALLNSPIRIEKRDCSKYPSIRIKWKNRFGGWDFYSFNLVSRETFETKRQKYQPQIGNWEGISFTYQDYESQTQNYLIDSKEKLRVNTDYVTEDHNDLFKSLMTSDEIYIVEKGNNGFPQLTPISITTNSFNVKTGTVDKLIQYAFDFEYGQPYKLVL